MLFIGRHGESPRTVVGHLPHPTAADVKPQRVLIAPGFAYYESHGFKSLFVARWDLKPARRGTRTRVGAT